NQSTFSCRPVTPQVFNLIVSVAPGAINGSYPAVIRASDGVLTYDLPITINIGDFSMNIVPNPIQMLPRQLLSSNVILASIFNYDQAVWLSCSAPAGVQCDVPPFGKPAPAGSQVSLGVQTQSTRVGNYQIVINGVSTPLRHSA